MGFVGYDPERVPRLRWRLVDLAEALRRVDPESRELHWLRARCRAVAGELEARWIPLCVQVTGCTAMGGGAAQLDDGLRDGLGRLGLLDPAWRVSTDGTRRGSSRPGGLGGDGVTTEPGDETIGDAPVVPAEDPSRWPVKDAPMPAAAGVPALLEQARLAGVDGPDGLDAWLGGVIGTADPGSVAALLTLLAQLGTIDPDQLGRHAAALAERWARGGGFDPTAPVTLAALDELAATVASSERAARAMVGTLWRAGRPGIDAFVAIARTATTAEAMLAPLLDPSANSAADAGAVLRPLLAAWREDGFGWPAHPRADGPGWDVALARLSAPWMPWFGPRAAAFGWEASAGAATLVDLLTTPEARAALTERAETWSEPLLDGLVDEGLLDLERIDAFTATTTMVAEAMRTKEQDNDATARALSAPLLGLVNLLPLAAKRAPLPARLVTKSAARRLSAELDDRLVRAGWLAPDAAESARRADSRWSDRTAAAGVLLFVAVSEAMIRDGELDPSARRRLDLSPPAHGACAAAVWRARIDRFIAEQPSAAARERLWAVRNAVLNDPTTAVACR